jgi:hypothetical protein
MKYVLVIVTCMIVGELIRHAGLPWQIAVCCGLLILGAAYWKE